VDAAQSRRVHGPESRNDPPNSRPRYPSGESPPRSRPPQTHDATPTPPTRHAAGAQVKRESPPRRPSDTAWESYPGAVPPARTVRPSPALCGKAGVNSVTLCHPLPYRLHIAPLERGRGNPRKCTTAYSAPAWDDVVTSGQQGASPPSLLALCGHPRLCAVIPGTTAASLAPWELGMMGHRHTHRCTYSDPLPARPLSRRTDGDQTRSSRVATLEAALGQSQDSPRRLLEVRFSRTIISSTALCATPPYVALEPCDMAVNRLPLAYKRRRWSPGRRGTTDSCTLAHFRPHPRYWHLASIKPQGPGDFSSSPALLVAPLCKHYGAPQYNALSAPPTGRTARDRNQDKSVSLYCLAPTIER
jgi:hypothetical protein